METETLEHYKVFLTQRGIGNGSIKNYIFCLRRFKYPFTATGIAEELLQKIFTFANSLIEKRFDVAVKYNGHTLEVSVVRSKALT